jgi:hypothetical protein
MMTWGAGEGSVGESEGVLEGETVEPDGGGAACADVKPSLGSIVGGKGD